MSDTPLMKCGHSANAVNGQGKPACVICVGIHPGAEEVEDNKPDISTRMATCPSCKKTKPSSYDLAFFEYRPERDTDSYYCGCRGWD